ncbi:NPCBM/NEW2 domain-containing protein [Peribacillus sp. NPDC046944]|uniref:NPCBM/NEW2 domain-containing protein n=1 Tax=unclassified Peribacillus TaxID=2675266 RepID=UPI003CFC595E
MKLKLFTFFTALLLILSFQQKEVAAAETDVLLTSLVGTYGSDVYKNSWNSSSFTDIKGNPIINGLGFGDSATASYNIKNEGYKTFRATLSLDSKWINGDYGKSAIGIYADDVLIYEYQLSKTKTVDVKISLPEKATKLKIVTEQLDGSKGTQGIIVANPTLSFSGTYSSTKDLSVSPRTIGASSYQGIDGNYVYTDINENIVTDGIRFKSTNGNAYATYNIKDMGFNQFSTKISLDSYWTHADYGQTVVGIYADDILLYEKEFTEKTKVASLKLRIPKGTNNIELTVKQIEGAKGTQGLVFINPLFEKTNAKPLVLPKTSLLANVGAIDYSGNGFSFGTYREHMWGSYMPFQYTNGQMITSGIGLISSNINLVSPAGSAFATYNIKNMGFNSLKTTLSLDSGWINGDYGKSSAYIYADNKLLYSRNLKKNDVKNLTLRLPKNTKTLQLYIQQEDGAKGKHRVVFGHARLTNLPVSTKPSANKISVTNNKNKSDVIIVRSLSKKDVVTVYDAKGKQLASGSASSSSITLKVKQLGKKSGKVYITRTSTGKLISDKTSVTFKAEK